MADLTHWRTLHRETIFAGGPIKEVAVETIELPDGRTDSRLLRHQVGRLRADLRGNGRWHRADAEAVQARAASCVPHVSRWCDRRRGVAGHRRSPRAARGNRVRSHGVAQSGRVRDQRQPGMQCRPSVSGDRLPARHGAAQRRPRADIARTGAARESAASSRLSTRSASPRMSRCFSSQRTRRRLLPTADAPQDRVP